jgi:hypothetical protein
MAQLDAGRGQEREAVLSLLKANKQKRAALDALKDKDKQPGDD